MEKLGILILLLPTMLPVLVRPKLVVSHITLMKETVFLEMPGFLAQMVHGLGLRQMDLSILVGNRCLMEDGSTLIQKILAIA